MVPLAQVMHFVKDQEGGTCMHSDNMRRGSLLRQGLIAGDQANRFRVLDDPITWLAVEVDAELGVGLDGLVYEV